MSQFSISMIVWAALAGVMLAAPSAQARPRDEVMSGAFRCASLGPSNMWLDCYYGAAQPARAALSLPSAPAAQIQLSRTAPATASGPVSDAPIRDQVMSRAFGCGGLADTRGWLNCYYGAAQPMRARLGLAPAPQAPQQPVRPATLASAAPPPARMAPSRPAPAAPPSGMFSGEERMVPLSSYRFDRHGMFTVTLANGQVWQQRDEDVNYAHWRGPAASHRVSVWSGAAGSWMLEDENDHTVYKIKPAQ